MSTVCSIRAVWLVGRLPRRQPPVCAIDDLISTSFCEHSLSFYGNPFYCGPPLTPVNDSCGSQHAYAVRSGKFGTNQQSARRASNKFLFHACIARKCSYILRNASGRFLWAHLFHTTSVFRWFLRPAVSGTVGTQCESASSGPLAIAEQAQFILSTEFVLPAPELGSIFVAAVRSPAPRHYQANFYAAKAK